MLDRIHMSNELMPEESNPSLSSHKRVLGGSVVGLQALAEVHMGTRTVASGDAGTSGHSRASRCHTVGWQGTAGGSMAVESRPKVGSGSVHTCSQVRHLSGLQKDNENAGSALFRLADALGHLSTLLPQAGSAQGRRIQGAGESSSSGGQLSRTLSTWHSRACHHPPATKPGVTTSSHMWSEHVHHTTHTCSHRTHTHTHCSHVHSNDSHMTHVHRTHMTYIFTQNSHLTDMLI